MTKFHLHYVYALAVLLFTSCVESKHEINLSASDKVIPFVLDTIRIKADSLIFHVKKELEVDLNNKTLSGKGKYRGGSSSKYFKKSYSLTFNDETNLEIFDLARKKWILNAGYVDKTYLRHKLCYDLFQSWDKDNVAAKTKYVWVIENSKSVGLYNAMTTIDKEFLKLSLSDTNACIFKDPNLFREAFMPPSENGSKHYQKFPKFSKHPKDFVLDNIHESLSNLDSTELFNYVNTCFDIRNIIDWHILVELSTNGDGVLKNFYLYKQHSDSLFKICPWDYDHSFGRCGDAEYMEKTFANTKRSLLFRKLSNSKEYCSLISERWLTLRSKGLISASCIAEMVNHIQNDIWKYMELDQEIWPLAQDRFLEESSLEKERDILLQRAKDKILLLDDYFNNFGVENTGL